MRILTQDNSTPEIRAARLGARLADTPALTVPFEKLAQSDLRKGDVFVGSVEYVLGAMRLRGIQPPLNMSYPQALQAYLHRKVSRKRLCEIDEGRDVFVKPVSTKLFTGFVLKHEQKFEAYDEHDQEQIRVMRSAASDTEVYVGEPVQFLSEWRYYVLRGEVIGSARYDPDGEDSAPEPNIGVVRDAVRNFRGPAAYALDFGVLSRGETALVEANDGWALGLYGQSLSAREYLDFLVARWNELEEGSPAA